MTYDSVRVSFVTRMNAWADAPIAWDGHAAPEAVKSAQAARSPWCRVSIQDGSREFATTGNLTEHSGVLFVQVFTDSDIGPKTARDLADSLAYHLDGYTDGTLVCRAASATPVGPDNGWYQVNVSVPWRVYA